MTDEISGDEAVASDTPLQIQISPEALERWRALDGDVPLKVALAKSEFDHLLLGLRSVVIGQSQLVSAVTAHINQDPKAAAEALLTADQLCVAAFNRINAFISAVMETATPDPSALPDAPIDDGY